MGDIAADFETKSAEPRYVFDTGRGIFWKEVSNEQWIEMREGALRRDLQKAGLAPKIDPAKGQISPLDDKIREIEQTSRVAAARRIAGWHAGVHVMGGDPVLVPEGLRLLVPRDGGEDGHLLVAAMLEQIFDGDEVDEDENGQRRVTRYDQRDWWLAWKQDWLRSLYSGRVTSGLAFALVGEPDCGKSRQLALSKACVGGKIGKPMDWMIGKEDKNKELFEASLLAIDDEASAKTREARDEMGAKVKKVVANEDNRLRGMQADGIVVQPNWRLWFNVNLQEGAILVLPALTGDLVGKMLMLKGYVRPRVPVDAAGREKYLQRYPALAKWWSSALKSGILREEQLARCWPMPMPADTQEEQEIFWKAVTAELPAFVFWLLEKYVPPSHVVGGRFRVRPWQHPDIVAALQEFSAHVHLWRLMKRAGNVWRRLISGSPGSANAEWEDVDEWVGSAGELRDLLIAEHNGLTPTERKSIAGASYVGTRLGEAESAWGAEVAHQKRSGKKRTWRLRWRPEVTGE